MSGSTPTSSYGTEDVELFKKLEAYPWASDEEFQNGLHTILNANLDARQAQHLTLQARCFYYSRQAPSAFKVEEQARSSLGQEI